MRRTEGRMRIYTVVDVMCGVAVGAKTFPDLKHAQTYLSRLRKRRNLDEDDVQLFDDMMALPARQSKGIRQDH